MSNMVRQVFGKRFEEWRTGVARSSSSPLIFLTALVACSGGAGHSSLPPDSSPSGGSAGIDGTIGTRPNTSPNPVPSSPVDPHAASRVPVPVTLTFVTSSASVAQSIRRGRQAVGGYVSTSNAAITVAVTPFGGSTQTYGPTACTNAASCTVSFTATPGPTTLAFTLTDASANVLSRFSTVSIIQPATANTLNFSANPVVNSVAVQLAAPSVIAGTPSDTLLTVNAKDAAGSTIVGTAPYVDANGNQVSFSLSVQNTQAGGRGSVALKGPLRVSSPGQQAVYAHYDGNWLASSTISVSASQALGGSTTGATLATIPNTIEYAASGSPFDITPGPDGNIWFTEFSGPRIGRITPAGVVTEFSQGPTSSGSVAGITTGPDGNLWFTKRSPNQVAVMTTSGAVIHEYAGSTNPREIITGSDGNLWVTEESGPSIDRLSTSGVFTYLASGYPNSTIGIARGVDGNVWYAYVFSGIGKITPRGVSTTYTTSVNRPHYMALGPDGNMWYTNNGGSGCIGQVSLQGVSTGFCSGITSSPGQSLGAIVAGIDGNMWFTNYSNDRIDRITPSGVVSEYATGITSGAQPYGICLGPDGNLWFTERGKNRVAKFVL